VDWIQKERFPPLPLLLPFFCHSILVVILSAAKDLLLFLSLCVVILSEARKAKSKDLRLPLSLCVVIPEGDLLLPCSCSRILGSFPKESAVDTSWPSKLLPA
jgi:hypothetical protein